MIRFEVCPKCLRKIERTTGLGRVRRILESCPTCRTKIGEWKDVQRQRRERLDRNARLAHNLFEAITRGVRI